MDKRTLLYQIHCFRDNNEIVINVYEKKSGYKISARFYYGELEIYSPRYASKKQVQDFTELVMKRYPEHIFERPFYKENNYIYMLGEKKYFTYNPDLKDNPNYFYLTRNTKDPLAKYKKLFLDYLKTRLVILGKKMNVDLSSWTIRTGLYLSYMGICFPTLNQMKFDYRLFAYESSISDSVLIHEIAHIFEISHNQRFYSIVKYYCPNYDYLQHEIELGHFEGEMDHVIPHY